MGTTTKWHASWSTWCYTYTTRGAWCYTCTYTYTCTCTHTWGLWLLGGHSIMLGMLSMCRLGWLPAASRSRSTWMLGHIHTPLDSHLMLILP